VAISNQTVKKCALNVCAGATTGVPAQAHISATNFVTIGM